MGPGPLSPRSICRAINDMRNVEAAWELYSPEDFDKMERYVRKEFAKGDWQDDRAYDGPGTTPTWQTYKGRGTALNLIKIAKVGSLDKEVKELYQELFHGRAMTHINKCVGQEIENLMEISETGRLCEAEKVRLRRQHQLHPDNVWMKRCEQFARESYCIHGATCSRWHMEG